MFSGGVPSGKYFLIAYTAAGDTPELDNNLSCLNLACEPEGGDPVTIIAGENTKTAFALLIQDNTNLPETSGKLSGIPATSGVRAPTFALKSDSTRPYLIIRLDTELVVIESNEFNNTATKKL